MKTYTKEELFHEASMNADEGDLQSLRERFVKVEDVKKDRRNVLKRFMDKYPDFTLKEAKDILNFDELSKVRNAKDN